MFGLFGNYLNTTVAFGKVSVVNSKSKSLPDSANLEISGESYAEEFEKLFSVGLSDIAAILNMTESVKSNSPYDVYIAVKNYGKEEIKNVNILVESDLFDGIQENT